LIDILHIIPNSSIKLNRQTGVFDQQIMTVTWFICDTVLFNWSNMRWLIFKVTNMMQFVKGSQYAVDKLPHLTH